jgi:adenylate cyclase
MHLTVRRLRLASGLVMLTYVTLHLINHALGIWSLDLAEAGLLWSIRLWRSTPGTLLLYGAAFVHLALAWRTVYERRHWRLPPIEWIRLWAGFSLPLLLIGHVVTTRVAASFYGIEPSYGRIVAMLVRTRTQGWQMALLAPGWVHGCLGLWLSLRRYAAMQRARPLLIGILVTMPLLSLLGFLRMSQAVSTVTPDARAVSLLDTLATWRHELIGLYVVLISSAFLAGLLRNRLHPDRAR